jgi:hypothetical protein
VKLAINAMRETQRAPARQLDFAEVIDAAFQRAPLDPMLAAVRIALVVSLMPASFQLLAKDQVKMERPVEHPTFYRTAQIDGLSIFYREAGPKDAPTLLLLPGFPSSSRMFQSLFGRSLGPPSGKSSKEIHHDEVSVCRR